MKYMLEDIVIINPNYSQVRDNVAKRVICNSNGGIKILNCNPEILDEVFNYVTNIQANYHIDKQKQRHVEYDTVNVGVGQSMSRHKN